MAGLEVLACGGSQAGSGGALVVGLEEVGAEGAGRGEQLEEGPAWWVGQCGVGNGRLPMPVKGR